MTTKTVSPASLSSGYEVLAVNGVPVVPFFVGKVRVAAGAPWSRRRWEVFRQDAFAQSPELVLGAEDKVTVEAVA